MSLGRFKADQLRTRCLWQQLPCASLLQAGLCRFPSIPGGVPRCPLSVSVPQGGAGTLGTAAPRGQHLRAPLPARSEV